MLSINFEGSDIFSLSFIPIYLKKIIQKTYITSSQQQQKCLALILTYSTDSEHHYDFQLLVVLFDVYPIIMMNVFLTLQIKSPIRFSIYCIAIDCNLNYRDFTVSHRSTIIVMIAMTAIIMIKIIFKSHIN